MDEWKGRVVHAALTEDRDCSTVPELELDSAAKDKVAVGPASHRHAGIAREPAVWGTP